MSNKGVADFVSRLMDKHSLPPDSLHFMINYVFRIQQKLSDVKKSVKRDPLNCWTLRVLLLAGRLIGIACHLSEFPVLLYFEFDLVVYLLRY